MEITSLHKAYYGNQLNPVEPNPEKCCESVSGFFLHNNPQCGNKRGHGPEGAYCGIHARKIIAHKPMIC